MSTAASRAWLGVALAGLVLIVLVVGLSLLPRLPAGQQVIDRAQPAFTQERIAATRSGVDVLSQYVDLMDPLLTSRGGGAAEGRSLVRLVRRELGISSAQARRILRREAPRTEALMRALPLERAAGELPALTSYLATALTMSEDDLAATLERGFPDLAQALTALPTVADTWYDVPGVEGFTRPVGDTPVRTVPGLRTYLRDDVVPRMAQHDEDFRSLAGSGGIGYIPYLLLVLGLVVFVYGVLQARRATVTAPGFLSWSILVALGFLLAVLVVSAQYFPRLDGAQDLVADLEPVFAQERVEGVSIGFDTVHEAVLLGDPIMTRRGGAARDTARLYRLVAQRSGRRRGDVRRSLMRRAPHTIALLDALPLSRVAREVPALTDYLARAFDMPRARVLAQLSRRAPGLTRALLAAPAVTRGWNALPGTRGATRFDGISPLASLPALDGYLREDLLPVLVKERTHFGTLAGDGPSLGTLAPVVLVYALFLVFYGGMMMQFVGRRDQF